MTSPLKPRENQHHRSDAAISSDASKTLHFLCTSIGGELLQFSVTPVLSPTDQRMSSRGASGFRLQAMSKWSDTVLSGGGHVTVLRVQRGYLAMGDSLGYLHCFRLTDKVATSLPAHLSSISDVVFTNSQNRVFRVMTLSQHGDVAIWDWPAGSADAAMLSGFNHAVGNAPRPNANMDNSAHKDMHIGQVTESNELAMHARVVAIAWPQLPVVASTLSVQILHQDLQTCCGSMATVRCILPTHKDTLSMPPPILHPAPTLDSWGLLPSSLAKAIHLLIATMKPAAGCVGRASQTLQGLLEHGQSIQLQFVQFQVDFFFALQSELWPSLQQSALHHGVLSYIHLGPSCSALADERLSQALRPLDITGRCILAAAAFGDHESLRFWSIAQSSLKQYAPQWHGRSVSVKHRQTGIHEKMRTVSPEENEIYQTHCEAFLIASIEANNAAQTGEITGCGKESSFLAYQQSVRMQVLQSNRGGKERAKSLRAAAACLMNTTPATSPDFQRNQLLALTLTAAASADLAKSTDASFETGDGQSDFVRSVVASAHFMISAHLNRMITATGGAHKNTHLNNGSSFQSPSGQIADHKFQKYMEQQQSDLQLGVLLLCCVGQGWQAASALATVREWDAAVEVALACLPISQRREILRQWANHLWESSRITNGSATEDSAALRSQMLLSTEVSLAVGDFKTALIKLLEMAASKPALSSASGTLGASIDSETRSGLFAMALAQAGLVVSDEMAELTVYGNDEIGADSPAESTETTSCECAGLSIISDALSHLSEVFASYEHTIK